MCGLHPKETVASRMGGHLNGGTCLGKNIDDVVMAIVGSQLQRRRFPIILSFMASKSVLSRPKANGQV